MDANHKESETSQLLLEPPREKQQPPLAGPEVDDLDEKPADSAPYPGINDGLLKPGDNKPDTDAGPELDDLDEKPAESAPYPGTDDGLLKPGDNKPDTDADTGEQEHKELDGGEGDGEVHDEGKWLMWDPDADYPDGEHGLDIPFPPGAIPNVNTYQQKKNLAQGMMDLALLSANANQLRYVLESSDGHPYFYPSLAFISMSIILQVAVGVGLIMNSRYDVNDKKDIYKADQINNMTVLGVFLVTVVNVFITSFSVATPPGGAPVNCGQT